MEVIQLFVTAYGVHVGIKAVSRMEVVAIQRHALPLGKGLNYLRILFGIGYIKANGPLIAIQVVVKTALRLYEQGGGYALKVQGTGKAILKLTFDEADGILSFIERHGGLISLGYKRLHSVMFLSDDIYFL